jgi:hypothetical protein
MSSILAQHSTFLGTKLAIDETRIGARTWQLTADGNGSLAGRNTR